MVSKVKQNLLEECLAYLMYGQEIHPTHVEDMIEESFEAGKKQAIFECCKCDYFSGLNERSKSE